MQSIGKITLCSFGFKYGSPSSNIYFDVTFLPNPVRLPGKNLFDDLDEDMYNLIADSERAKILVKKIADFAVFMSEFDDVRIGIGCNSGRHRSVVIVNEVSKLISEANIGCHIVHRELENIDKDLN